MASTRRKWLAAIAASASLAGCISDGDSGDDEETDDGDAGTDASWDGTTDGGSGGDGGSDGESDDGSDGGSDGGTAGASVTVSTGEHEELGEILTDGDGMVLYMYDPDPQGDGASECTGGCASSWPPLVTDDGAQASDAVTASLSTFERSGGATQVAANGWPLYYWQGDSEPGDATGQGVNDVWWVLDPAGEPIR